MKPFGLAAVAFAAAFAVSSAEPALAAGVGSFGDTGETLLILQIALLLLIGRGLGEVLQRIGQPAVVGQLLAGLILGPTVFGFFLPGLHAEVFSAAKAQRNLLTGLSEIGVLLLLLLTGMETDLKLARKVGPPALAVATAGVALPFAGGFAFTLLLPASLLPNPGHRLAAALFLGTALSISSIKIVAMVVREMDFLRRDIGQIIVASAIIEDVVGWLIISFTLGMTGAAGATLPRLTLTLGGTALFLLFSLTLGRRFVFWLIRWVNDVFVSEFAVVTAILVVMCAMALITERIGINTVLGAFVAGVLVGQSPILTRHIDEQLRGLITAFFMPLFFGLSGLSADLTILGNGRVLAFTAALVAVASIGKFAGAYVGGRIGRLSGPQSLALGCAMNARGSTEVIVASIGLGVGALSHSLYSMIVCVAILTTVAMPPMLRRALARLPVKEEEETRLAQEQLDETGFVSRLERLLIAADDSANGRFATKLAGFIAGHRGTPLTVLKRATGAGASAKKDGADLARVASESAETGKRAAAENTADAGPDKAHVSTKNTPALDSTAVTEEADKGYGILFIGLQNMLSRTNAFSTSVDEVAAGFPGPLALVFAGDADGLQGLRLLVPVNGTAASRQGAELAFALAQRNPITILHVAERSTTKAPRPRRRDKPQGRNEKAVLENILALARRYGHEDVQTAVHSDILPAEAILAEARRSGATVIAMGAHRRVGDALYLGQTVERVLARWNGAAIVLAV